MFNDKIREGLSVKYTKITTASDAFVTNKTTIDYLLSTPAIVSMVIDSSCNMLDKLLPQQYITVGSRVEVHHNKPTLIGEQITLTTTVKNVKNQIIFLEFDVCDSCGLVSYGSCERIIVNKDDLMKDAFGRIHDCSASK